MKYFVGIVSRVEIEADTKEEAIEAAKVWFSNRLAKNQIELETEED